MDDTEKNQKALDWINSKWVGEKKCPICHNHAWNVNIDTGAISLVKGVDVVLGTYYPFVVVNCTVCGYTILFNQVIMGLLPGTPPPQTPQNATPTDPEKKV